MYAYYVRGPFKVDLNLSFYKAVYLAQQQYSLKVEAQQTLQRDLTFSRPGRI